MWESVVMVGFGASWLLLFTRDGECIASQIRIGEKLLRVQLNGVERALKTERSHTMSQITKRVA